MYFFVGSACPRPFDSFQVVHVGPEDEPLIAEHFMDDVFDSIVSITLILQPQKLLAIVAEVQSHFGLHTLLHYYQLSKAYDISFIPEAHPTKSNKGVRTAANNQLSLTALAYIN